MKASEVYRKAAELIASCGENYSCIAVMNAAAESQWYYGLNAYFYRDKYIIEFAERYSEESNEYGELIQTPFLGVSQVVRAAEEVKIPAQELRVWMLLQMAAMCEVMEED